MKHTYTVIHVGGFTRTSKGEIVVGSGKVKKSRVAAFTPRAAVLAGA